MHVPSLIPCWANMQETVVQVFLCKLRSASNEVGLSLCCISEDGEVCKRNVLCVFCACWHVLICDVVCCHCCGRCVVGCVSVGVDAMAVVW